MVTRISNDFCVVELSSFYLDIIKDRLYCEDATGNRRRSAQTALYLIVDAMAKLFAPILAFTCDEIWQAMPHLESDDKRNILLNQMPENFDGYTLDDDTMHKWDGYLIPLRQDVNGILEKARADKRIGKALEAHVTLSRHEALEAATAGMDLAELFIVSSVSWSDPEEGALSGEGSNFGGITIGVSEAKGTKCPRCWMHSFTDHADGLCARCAGVIAKLDVEI